MDTADLMDLFLHNLQQAYHVIGGRAWMCDHKVGISFAYLGSAYFGSCKSGLIDETRCLIAAADF